MYIKNFKCPIQSYICKSINTLTETITNNALPDETLPDRYPNRHQTTETHPNPYPNPNPNPNPRNKNNDHSNRPIGSGMRIMTTVSVR
jgi:hypothetical protein